MRSFEYEHNMNFNSYISLNQIESPLNEHYFPSNDQLNYNSSQQMYNMFNIVSRKPVLLSLREEREFAIKQRLVLECEELFTKILKTLSKNEKFEIYLIDLEKNSRFYYDKGYFTFSLSPIANGCLESGEKVKYLAYNLYEDSERLAKILKVCTIIYQKSLKNTSMTKRELYYNDVELFKNTGNIDTLLHDLSSIFNMSRFDLSVFPAQKGLFAGDIIVYDSEGNMLNNSHSFDKINLITFEYFFEEISIQTTATFILIVEKESLFFNIIGNKVYSEIFSNSIIITGKGFPDYITKFFIKKISHLANIPILYFGDFDPSGLEIYFNYVFGCKTSSRENPLMCINNINWIGLSYDNIQSLIEIEGEGSLQLIKIDDKELKKIDTILLKEFFNLEAWGLSCNPYTNCIIRNLQVIFTQFEMMKQIKYKAEGEVLISNYMEHFVDYLKFYLLNLLN